MSKRKFEFRDVSNILKRLRQILLGRPHNLHVRFPPLVSSRTIPKPDIPRGPDDSYSNKYYYQRNAMDSVKPPVVAPVAEGLALDPKKGSGGGAATLSFSTLPTPGTPFWWDGHCYYECVPDLPKPAPASCSPSPPASPPPKKDECKKETKK